jgi:hypothetical protein
LKDKFSWDKKFARIFKRLVPSGKVSDNIWFFEVLKYIKNKLSEKVNKNKWILENEWYFRKSVYPIISESKFEKNISLEIKEKIRDYVADEYLKEYRGT